MKPSPRVVMGVVVWPPEAWTQRSCTRLLAAGVGLLALVFCVQAFRVGVNHDEIEHAHVVFRLLQGELPWRDFYQNHWPAFWLLQWPFITAFPYSLAGILWLRALYLALLVCCWLLGLRLLAAVRGGITGFGLVLYTWAVVLLAWQLEFTTARPDPLMTFLGTAGLCLMPLRGMPSAARALLIGVLFGLATSVSTKILPLALVPPAVWLLQAGRQRRLPLTAWACYLLGGMLGLLPTLLWLAHHDLFAPFWRDVSLLNRALAKPWWRAAHIVDVIVWPVAVGGALVLWRDAGRRLGSADNRAPVLACSMLAMLVLAVLIRHWSEYNFQAMIIPLAVGVTALLLVLSLRLRQPALRVLLCATVLAYPTLDMAKPSLAAIALGKSRDSLLPLGEAQWLVEQARLQARRQARPEALQDECTCTAFSPNHPVFCRDVSGLSLRWDIFFPRQIMDAAQLARFRALWQEGLARTVAERPDIIVRRPGMDIWAEAVVLGMITPAQLAELDALREEYVVTSTHSQEVWVRKDRH